MRAKISDAEYEVMEAVWGLGEATVSQLQAALAGKKWAYNTVATFAARLVEKGFLNARSEGKAKIYTACIGSDEYKVELTHDFLNGIHSGSKRSMLAALFDRKASDKIIDKLISELEQN